MNDNENIKRFERTEGYLESSHKVREWNSFAETDTIGGFLSKLWRLFGLPDENGEGFEYLIKDNKTGVIFNAYSAGSGPAFGGIESAQLEESLDDFETLLENTIPADCEFEFPTDYGVYRTGARNGIPFGKTIPEDETLE